MRHGKWLLLGLMLVLPFALLMNKPKRVLIGGEDAVSAVDKSETTTTAQTRAAAEAVKATAAAKNKHAPPVEITAEDHRQAKLTAAILASKNDNDPRLDTELRVLGEGAKYLLKAHYLEVRPEGLNERGTIAFLLGRNLATPNDIFFMQSIVESSRCLSLADCSRAEGAQDAHHEAHHSGTNAITLAYPQIVALKAIESFLNRTGTDAQMVEAARGTLYRAAQNSADPLVAGYARSVLARLGD